MASTRTFTFLGTGTSMGVPMVGCDCTTCASTDPKNHRYRCAVVLETPAGNILIDTPPELRLQLLRAKVNRVHAVLFTHYHVDHLYGLDDVRPLCKHLGGPMPVYCTDEVEERIRSVFYYAFTEKAESLPAGHLPKFDFRRLREDSFNVLGQRITPIPLLHAHFNVLGFRVDNVAYCTDVNHIPERSWPLLEGLDVLILDALRPKPHPAHFGLDEALAVIARVKPRRAYLTHMGHELEHVATTQNLPDGVELAYDGLRFHF